jgi:hypothetical protein
MLGEKRLIRSINTLGRKTTNTVNKIGQKVDGGFNKVENTVNRVDNQAENAINKASNLGQKIVDKSGRITDGLRAGSNIANAVATNLAMAGVPGAGVAMTVTKGLANGANKLDNKRDKLANQIENARQNSILEKNNLRKKVSAQNEKLQDQAQTFI